MGSVLSFPLPQRASSRRGLRVVGVSCGGNKAAALAHHPSITIQPAGNPSGASPGRHVTLLLPHHVPSSESAIGGGVPLVGDGAAVREAPRAPVGLAARAAERAVGARATPGHGRHQRRRQASLAGERALGGDTDPSLGPEPFEAKKDGGARAETHARHKACSAAPALVVDVFSGVTRWGCECRDLHHHDVVPECYGRVEARLRVPAGGVRDRLARDDDAGVRAVGVIPGRKRGDRAE